MSTLPSSLAAHPSLDSWVRINVDGTVTFFSGKVELGQGIEAALARLGAEELDVDLGRVTIQPADTAHGLDEGLTAGSRSLEESGEALRFAAASAREHLLELAAAALDADASSLEVTDGTVRARDGRTVSYWELLGGGRFDFSIDGPRSIKAPTQRTLVGRSGPRPDLPGLLDGSIGFVGDLAPPGLLHGRVVRPPSPSAKLQSIDRDLPDVTVVRDGSFLGVIADREEMAVAAADRLRSIAHWSGAEQELSSEEAADWLRQQPSTAYPVVDGLAIEGDVVETSSHSDAETQIAACYSKPFTMHGSIGPSAALAEFNSDGDLTVWSASQGIYLLRQELARVLGMDAAKVRVIHVRGPGCYGHNGADDVSLDASLLARAVPGRPVRIQWSREDEHGWEPYGPAAVVELEAGLDSSGSLTSWSHDVYSNSHFGRPGMSATGSQLIAAWHLATPSPPPPAIPMLGFHTGIHRNADPLYEVPNRRIVKHFVEFRLLRTSALRSLGAYVNVFAIESFMDELADAADADPVEFRLRYLTDPRAREVLELAARMASWPADGVGIAFARYKNAQAYAAVAVQLGVDDATAEIKLQRAWIAADAGEVVDPDGLVNQLEGGFVQSASWTLKEAVLFDSTQVTSLDWETYPIVTFHDVPEIETKVIDRPGLPILGAGEATQGPTAAAIANAVYRASGIRLRDVPFTPDRVRDRASRI